MTETTFTNPQGGLWPLGFIQVVTSGTPVQITTNVGQQSQGKQYTRQFTGQVRGLIISTPSLSAGGKNGTGNTKNVYLCMNNSTKTGVKGVLLCIPPGANVAAPQSLLNSVQMNPDQFYLDADVSGEGAYITAIYG